MFRQYRTLRDIGVPFLERFGLYWRAQSAKDWLCRVLYCHHNARVLSDMEYRMACVLTQVTRGMSNPYYSIDDISCAIQDLAMDDRNEAFDDGVVHGRESAFAEMGLSVPDVETDG